MKTYMVLFREPDGRLEPHTAEETANHRARWAVWQDGMVAKQQLIGGNALTLNGVVIGTRVKGQPVTVGAYYINKTEMVGGYLLIKAQDINDATELIKTCPVFDHGAFAEIREVMES